MKKLFIVFFSFVLYSCQTDYSKNKIILKAEKLLSTDADSAFLLLNSIDYPERLSKADHAAWCLNLTYSQYKLQKEIESDSLIMIPIKYYTGTQEAKISAQHGF